MNHTKNNHTFQKDQRLEHLDQERLATLMSYAKELSDAPQDQKMQTFLSINKRAAKENISFSGEERDLLIQVLTEHMTPEEKKRVELIKSLASKFSSARK